MNCTCGGVLDVIRIEKPPEHLPKHEKLLFNRVCDVECLECGKIYYSQPYDFMRKFNSVKDLS